MKKIARVQSDLNNTIPDISKHTVEVIRMQNNYENLRICNHQYQIIAPQTRYIHKALRQGIGETIKEGEAVAVIMPDSPRLAVEMYVKAMDVPLIERGRKVRIHFDVMSEESPQLDSLIFNALESHPELQKLNFKLDQLQLDLRLAKENLKPKLDQNYSLLIRPLTPMESRREYV